MKVTLPRPSVESYPVILKGLERSKVDQLALEFEASRFDPKLLRLCPSKTMLYSCIDNGALNPERVEIPEQVASKLLAATQHLPADQIQAAPDCGLLPLCLQMARQRSSQTWSTARSWRANNFLCNEVPIYR